MTNNADTLATVAYTSAVLMLNNLFAGADPDQKTEILVRILPFFEGCAVATCDALSGAWNPRMEPSRN